MNHYILLFFKGVAMGVANVIPGVSGGTIALVTGIYEEFIDALKSFDLTAAKLLSKRKIKDFALHVNLPFLIPLFLGVGAGLFTLGKVLDWLFQNHPTLVWSFFFGLILASVYYVFKNVKQRSVGVVIGFSAGLAIASSMTLMNPAAENDSWFYVGICGVVAICSMILPGLSGSFVLILMGNYQLVMLQAVPNLNFRLLAPFAVGAAVGFVALSHLISYLMRRFHDPTLSVLTGFIFGSLAIIWPWKSETYLTKPDGSYLLKEGEKIVSGYQWSLPHFDDPQTAVAAVLIIAGIGSVALLELTAKIRKPTEA